MAPPVLRRYNFTLTASSAGGSTGGTGTSSTTPPQRSLKTPCRHRMTGSQMARRNSRGAYVSRSSQATTNSNLLNGSEVFWNRQN